MQKSQTSLNNTKPLPNNNGDGDLIRTEAEENSREVHQEGAGHSDSSGFYSPGRQIVVVHNSSSEQSEITEVANETESEAIDYGSSTNEQAEIERGTETENKEIYSRNNLTKQTASQEDTENDTTDTEDEEMDYRYPDDDDDDESSPVPDNTITGYRENEEPTRKENQDTKHHQGVTSPTAGSSGNILVADIHKSSSEQTYTQGKSIDSATQENVEENTRNDLNEPIIDEKDDDLSTKFDKDTLNGSRKQPDLVGQKTAEQDNEENLKEKDDQSEQRPSINVNRMFSQQDDDVGSRCNSTV